MPADAWSPAPHRARPRGRAATGGDQPRPPTTPSSRLAAATWCVRIGLRGDGWATPSVDELLVEPETAGLERFLPAVYRSDDRTPTSCAASWRSSAPSSTQVEQSLRSLPARFSPRAVPGRAARHPGGRARRAARARLDRRATADDARPRRRAGTGRRGTPGRHPGAAAHPPRGDVRSSTLPPSVPVLVEGFRERPGALLGRVAPADGRGRADLERRRRGPAGAGPPGCATASAWCRSATARPTASGCTPTGSRSSCRARSCPARPTARAFERLIAAEKPAHVAHELVLVEPRAVVGQQGWLGVDTYVGDWPVARLAPAGCEAASALGLGLRLGARRARQRPAGRRPR